MTEFTWTPDSLQKAFTEKQRKLSEAMNLKPDIETDFEQSKKEFECKEAELSLLYELGTNGDRISDPKIKFKVKNTKIYQDLWENYISAKSQLRKCKMEIDILQTELDTLSDISMLLMAEMKHVK